MSGLGVSEDITKTEGQKLSSRAEEPQQTWQLGKPHTASRKAASLASLNSLDAASASAHASYAGLHHRSASARHRPTLYLTLHPTMQHAAPSSPCPQDDSHESVAALNPPYCPGR